MNIREETWSLCEESGSGVREAGRTADAPLKAEFRFSSAEPAEITMEPVRASVSMDSGWLDLRLDMDGFTAAEREQILRAYQEKKTFVRLQDGAWLKLADRGLPAVTRLGRGLDLDDRKLASGRLALPAYRAVYLDRLFREDPGVAFFRDRPFKAAVRRMTTAKDSAFAVPSALRHVLRGYQKEGVQWLYMLDAGGFGGILADDMGLGKTVQIIVLFADVYAKKGNRSKERSLIVCPASLVSERSRPSAPAPALR